MNKYVGKICPFCKCEFEENDEIVVCSDCEMPHHKDCWIENQGCTTFGCSGTIQGIDGAEVTMPAAENAEERTIFCPQCGEPSSSKVLFCSKCGSRLIHNQAPRQEVNPVAYTYSNAITPSYEMASENDDTISRLVGSNADYYVPRFKEFKETKRPNSWNWAAFWLGPYWLIYRKMYLFGYLTLAATVLSSIVACFSTISIGGYVLWGIFSTRTYMAQLEKKAREVDGMPEPYKTTLIEQKGGVNIVAPILTAVGHFILTILIFG